MPGSFPEGQAGFRKSHQLVRISPIRRIPTPSVRYLPAPRRIRRSPAVASAVHLHGGFAAEAAPRARQLAAVAAGSIEPALLAGRTGGDRGQKHGASAGNTSRLETENDLEIARHNEPDYRRDACSFSGSSPANPASAIKKAAVSTGFGGPHVLVSTRPSSHEGTVHCFMVVSRRVRKLPRA